MKKLLKGLAFAVCTALALFVLGCDNPAGGDLTEGSDGNSTVDALVEYYSHTALNIHCNRLDMNAMGFGVYDVITSPQLVDGITHLVDGIEITGTLIYTAKTNEESPYFTYSLNAKDPQTLDPYPYTSEDVTRIVTAIQDKLSGMSLFVSLDFGTTYTPGSESFTDGYDYFGSVSGIVTEYPDAGNIKITIELVKDPAADQTKLAVSGVTDVSIGESSTVTITGAGTAAGSYDGVSKTLTVTVPAAGITRGGAGGVAAAFVSAVTGKIANNKDTGYARPLSASSAIDGSNVVISIKLGTTFIQGTTLAGAINGVENDEVAISGTGVSGGFITGFANIPGAAAGVTALYNPNDHVLTFTITAPAGHEFNPEGDYSAAGNALGGKINITTDDGNYTGAASTPAAVIGGKLIITAILQEVNPASLPLIGAIKGASDGDLTGALITALTNIPDVTGAVTVATIMNGYATEGISLTIAPAADRSFSTEPGAYSAAASALNGKIGTVSVPGFGPPTLMRTNGTQAAITGDNLVFTVSLVNR
ncbi:MAG: hypothetical protein LBP76_02390 [Treponema sp.]|jgi:hypothetical protein|nr:hypothetical protein [Treponema sp.]